MEKTLPDANPCLRLTAPGKVEVVELPVPEPAAGEVLIRARRSLISTGTELTLFGARSRPDSTWAEITQFPRPIGYSHVGEVVAVGGGVDGSWLGRRVESHADHDAYAVWPVADVRPVPDAVSDDDATFTTLAEVAMNGLRRVGLRWGESVAVFGLGIVGQLCVRAAAVAGAGPVFGVELSELRLGKLPRHPAVHPLRGGDVEELVAAVRARNHGRRVDVVVETTAEASLIPEELGLLRDLGRFLVLSSPRGATSFDFHDLCNRRSLTLVGSHGSSHPAVATPDNPWTGRRHGELFLDWLESGRVSVDGMISHRFSYRRAAEAYELLHTRRGEALGVLFEWDRE
jgi:threonine dehydrogenase-like Zn-dependent dehydrogenase